MTQVQVGADRRETWTHQFSVHTIFKALLHIYLLTTLFCPGVKLLPQVDDFNAQTLLTVRPLQVGIKPLGLLTNRQPEICPGLSHKAMEEADAL